MNSEQATIKRLNRALSRADDVQRVRICRETSPAWLSLGRYYAVDTSRNIVTATHVNPDAWLADMRVG